MPIGIGPDHDALADSLARFAARHTPVARTRDQFDRIARGDTPDFWEQLVQMGIPPCISQRSTVVPTPDCSSSRWRSSSPDTD